jgi:hypothetical protein
LYEFQDSGEVNTSGGQMKKNKPKFKYEASWDLEPTEFVDLEEYGFHIIIENNGKKKRKFKIIIK